MMGLERGGIWDWGSGIGGEGEPPSVTLRVPLSPRGGEGTGEGQEPPPSRWRGTPPPEARGRRVGVDAMVLKSYLANWFVVCMVGIVADGVGGSRAVVGIAGFLRTDAGSVGEIGAQSV